MMRTKYPYDIVRLINDHHTVTEIEWELLANVPVHNVIVWHQHEL